MIFNPRPVKREGAPPVVAMVVVETTSGEEVPVHVFGSGDEETDVARKTAHAFSHWTGKPVTDIPVEPAPPGLPPARGFKDALAANRRAAAETRTYRDLV